MQAWRAEIFSSFENVTGSNFNTEWEKYKNIFLIISYHCQYHNSQKYLQIKLNKSD